MKKTYQDDWNKIRKRSRTQLVNVGSNFLLGVLCPLILPLHEMLTQAHTQHSKVQHENETDVCSQLGLRKDDRCVSNPRHMI